MHLQLLLETIINYKFVIVNPPAGDNWESTPNRPFTVTAPATVNYQLYGLMMIIFIQL